MKSYRMLIGGAWFEAEGAATFESVNPYIARPWALIPHGGAADVGLATGSQFNLLMTTDDMVRQAGGDARRVIVVHEARLKQMFPSRITEPGLSITELALAGGESSRVA